MKIHPVEVPMRAVLDQESVETLPDDVIDALADRVVKAMNRRERQAVYPEVRHRGHVA